MEFDTLFKGEKLTTDEFHTCFVRWRDNRFWQ